MGAQADVVHETPVEKDGRIDESTAVVVEDEFPRKPHMMEILHLVTR